VLNGSTITLLQTPDNNYAFDGWGVSTWFVEPHESLARHRPVDLLESNLRAILQAARADHAVGAG